MTADELRYLTSAEGREMLERYKGNSDRELEDILFKQKKKKIPYLGSVFTLLKLRSKAKEKFSKYDRMFFTSPGLEQSGGENIAKYIAKRFSGKKKVVDLTCGIGGNSIAIARYCRVVAVERSKEILECAKLNCAVYGVESSMEFVHGDAYESIFPDADAFFIDPMREREGKTKTRSVLNSEPDMFKILPRIFKVTSDVCVKISPAFDYKEIKMLTYDPEIEIISENNTNKAALLWFGRFKKCQRRATIVDGDSFYTQCDNGDEPAPSLLQAPLEYLYDPNKAFGKARIVYELANCYGLSMLNSDTSLMTGDKPLGCPKGIFRELRISAWGRYSPRKLKDNLRELGITRANIVVKKFPLPPEEIYKKLKLKRRSEIFFCMLPRFGDEKFYYIICIKDDTNL